MSDYEDLTNMDSGGFSLWAMLSGNIDRVAGIIRGTGRNALRRQHGLHRAKGETFPFWDAFRKSFQQSQAVPVVQEDAELVEAASSSSLSQKLKQTMSPHGTSAPAFSAVTGESARHIRDAAVAAAIGSLATPRNQAGDPSFVSYDNDNRPLAWGERMKRSVLDADMVEIQPGMLGDDFDPNATLEHEDAA